MKRQKINLCMGCMNPLDENGNCCCGFTMETYRGTPRCLLPGTLLKERYLIGKVLGEGSFGITYIGKDILLGITVAVKEHFPLNLVSRDVRKGNDNTVYVFQGQENTSYQKGLKQFYNEAKTLSQFHQLEGIVSVRDFFYGNGTAYLVMDYVSGMNVKQYIREHGPIEGEEALAWMKPVIHSLGCIHEAGIIHRDISPDNLILTKDKKIVLIDFGSARNENIEMTKSMTVMFKRGYTPEEQYRSRGHQGAWSDIYALCATIYFMVTADTPNEAIERMLQDRLVPLTERDEVSLTQNEKKALMKGIAIKAEDRFQSMEELLRALYKENDKVGMLQKISLRLREKKKICIWLAAGVLISLLAGSILHQGIRRNAQQQDAMAVATVDMVDAKEEPTSESTLDPTSEPTAEPISASEKMIHMISFCGLTRKQSRKQFKQLKDPMLKLQWKSEYSEEVQKGKVIRQSIPEEMEYVSGKYKKLVLTVSKGSKISTATPEESSPVSGKKDTTGAKDSSPETKKSSGSDIPDDGFVGVIP